MIVRVANTKKNLRTNSQPQHVIIIDSKYYIYTIGIFYGYFIFICSIVYNTIPQYKWDIVAVVVVVVVVLVGKYVVCSIVSSISMNNNHILFKIRITMHAWYD